MKFMARNIAALVSALLLTNSNISTASENKITKKNPELYFKDIILKKACESSNTSACGTDHLNTQEWIYYKEKLRPTAQTDVVAFLQDKDGGKWVAKINGTLQRHNEEVKKLEKISPILKFLEKNRNENNKYPIILGMEEQKIINITPQEQEKLGEYNAAFRDFNYRNEDNKKGIIFMKKAKGKPIGDYIKSFGTIQEKDFINVFFSVGQTLAELDAFLIKKKQEMKKISQEYYEGSKNKPVEIDGVEIPEALKGAYHLYDNDLNPGNLMYDTKKFDFYWIDTSGIEPSPFVYKKENKLTIRDAVTHSSIMRDMIDNSMFKYFPDISVKDTSKIVNQALLALHSACHGYLKVMKEKLDNESYNFIKNSTIDNFKSLIEKWKEELEKRNNYQFQYGEKNKIIPMDAIEFNKYFSELYSRQKKIKEAGAALAKAQKDLESTNKQLTDLAEEALHLSPLTEQEFAKEIGVSDISELRIDNPKFNYESILQKVKNRNASQTMTDEQRIYQYYKFWYSLKINYFKKIQEMQKKDILEQEKYIMENKSSLENQEKQLIEKLF